MNLVTAVGTCTTNTDMRGTDSAALASVCTETRLAELDAANLPADIDDLTTAVGEQASVCTEARLAELDAANLPADVDDLTTAVGELEAGSGLSAQETRDAMKLAPSSGTPAPGSVDEHLDAIQDAVEARSGTGGSGTGSGSITRTGGFLSRTLAFVRDFTDEPEANAKYSDDRIIQYIQRMAFKPFGELNRILERPLTARFDVTIVADNDDDEFHYILPPGVGMVTEIWELDSSSNKIAPVEMRGRLNPFGQGIAIEGGILTVDRNQYSTGNILRIVYVPDGLATMHEGVLDGLGVYGEAGVTVSSDKTLAATHIGLFAEVGDVITLSNISGDNDDYTVASVDDDDTVTLTEDPGDHTAVYYQFLHAETSRAGSTGLYATLASSPTAPSTGGLDTRQNAYAGMLLRILTVDSEDQEQDRVISAYDPEARVATLRAALDPVPDSPTDDTTYEIAPTWGTMMDLVVALATSKFIAEVEGNRGKGADLRREYQEAMRELRLLAANADSFNAGALDRGRYPGR